MTEFLKTVAMHYKEKAMAEARETGEPASMPLSRYVFCFPNHRSALFFSRHLHEVFGGACCVPATITIDELFGLFSNRCIADRTTLLFRLFNIYRKLSKRADKEEFDQFVFWGDMLLSDFDDIDKYLVPAERIFSNIRDLKEIDAAFAGFEPEVVEIIQSFWRNYKPANMDSEDEKREVFSQTWSILNDLYILFKEDLAKENLAYAGMMEREVVETEDLHLERLPYKKVVFVGLTAISKADRKLMSRLLLDQRAEFCWDYADPLIKDKHSPMSSAAFFTAANLHDFPNEISDEELAEGLVADKERKYSLYEVPSGVGQAQLARQILKQWKEKQDKNFDPIRTAVILPDERLLIPMLYAVPTELGIFNVTMGYGLKNTPVAAFVQNLANLQDAYRHQEDQPGSFYYRQVLPLLQHNYVTAITGDVASQQIKRITENNLYQVPVTDFEQDPLLSSIFRPSGTAEQTIDYLLEILENIMQHHELFSETDYEFIYHYRATVSKLGESVRQQTFDFTPRTLFMLLNKLVNGVSVPFSGEPLQGLQIMGVLETRSLDFDNVIFLSMNEGIFPAKPSSNTFVPMSLRNAFGMPTQKHRDAVFAYHFYRLISRAKNVVMIYDSRTDGMQTGEESRYVKQLRYLLNHDELKAKVISSSITTQERSKIEVKKTPEMLEQLRKSLAPNGNRVLSASSLKDYIKCPLRFYLGFVNSLKEDKDVNADVDQRTFGDILHDALCRLYSQCEGHRVDAGLLKQYIEHPEGEVTRAIHEGFKKVMKINRIEGYNLLISHILTQYAVETLRHDKDLGLFEYIAGERHLFVNYKASNGIQVKVICVIDRIDKVLTDGTIRIVDYKTGSSSRGSKLVLNEIPQLFTSEGKGSAEAFQVMLYCLMLMHATPNQLADLHLTVPIGALAPHLYFIRDFKQGAKTSTCLTISEQKEKEDITDFAKYAADFRKEFDQLLADIFDPEKTFYQCEDDHHCKYCAFASYCQR